ncbi:acylglycerol kinase family protein, partial [Nanoarchaeota archaeon]
MKYLLIINPRAGKSLGIEKDVVGMFEKKKKKLDVVHTQRQRHAISLAKKAVGKYDVVIAAGGDGTINEVINGL